MRLRASMIVVLMGTVGVANAEPGGSEDLDKVGRGAAAAWTAAATENADLLAYLETLQPLVHNPCATGGVTGPRRDHRSMARGCKRAGLTPDP